MNKFLTLLLCTLTFSMLGQNKGFDIGFSVGTTMPMGDYAKEVRPSVSEEFPVGIGAVVDYYGYEKTRKGTLQFNLDGNYYFGKFGFGLSLGQFKHQVSDLKYDISMPTSYEGGDITGFYYGLGPSYKANFGKFALNFMARAGMMNLDYTNFTGYYNGTDVSNPVPLLITEPAPNSKTSLLYSSFGVQMAYALSDKLSLFTKLDYLTAFGDNFKVNDTYYLPFDIDNNNEIDAFEVMHFTLIDYKREEIRSIKPQMLNIGVGLSYNIGVKKNKIGDNKKEVTEQTSILEEKSQSFSCDAPKLLSPRNNMVYIDTPKKKNTKAVFQWNKNSDAKSYEFQILDKKNQVVFSKTLEKNELRIDLTDLKIEKGLYYWKVGANLKECGRKESKPNGFYYNKNYTYTGVVLTDYGIDCGDAQGNNYDSNGNVLYHGHFTLENISTSNASVMYNNGFLTVNNNGNITQSNAFPPGPMIIPFSIAPGQNITFNFILKIPVGTPNAHITTTGTASDGDVEVEGFDIDLPACVCEVCDKWSIRTDKEPKLSVGSAYQNTYLNIYDHLYVTGSGKIKEIQADIAFFFYVAENEECMQCTPQDKSKGKFFTTSRNRPVNFRKNTPWRSNGEAYYRKDGVATQVSTSNITNNNPLIANSINWLANTGQEQDLSAGKPIHLMIGLPSQSRLECCKDAIKVCIRYTFIDENCDICEKLVCYSLTRTKPTDNGGVSTPVGNIKK